MPYEEKPPTRILRIAWLVGAWMVFIGPTVVLFLLPGVDGGAHPPPALVV
jgi:hypothetical protein